MKYAHTYRNNQHQGIFLELRGIKKNWARHLNNKQITVRLEIRWFRSRALTASSSDRIQDDGRAGDLKGGAGVLPLVEVDGCVQVAEADVAVRADGVQDELYGEV